MKEGGINSDIVRSAQGGDREAFKKIYLEFSPMVWGLALKFTGDTVAAEDAAAEIFVKLHKKIGSFNFRSSFKTWLYRFSVNTVINYLKKEKLRNTEKLPQGTAEENSARSRREKSAKKEFVWKLLRKLDASDRKYLVLREIEGRTYKEISDILDINPGTVKTNIYRAREKFRKIYNEEKSDEMH